MLSAPVNFSVYWFSLYAAASDVWFAKNRWNRDAGVVVTVEDPGGEPMAMRAHSFRNDMTAT